MIYKAIVFLLGKTHLHTGSFFIFKIFSYGSSYKPVKPRWILIPSTAQTTISESRKAVLSQEWLWTLTLAFFAKVDESTWRYIFKWKRSSDNLFLSVVKWDKGWVRWFLSTSPVFLQQVEEPCKAEDQCYRTVLLLQLFSIDQASAMHKTEKPVLFPLRQEVYCFTLEFVCLLSDSWGILSIHGSFEALLPAACRFWFTYISAWSDFARDPHWPQLAFAASKTCSRLILMSLVLRYCKIS